MVNEDILQFKEEDYLEDVQEEILNENHTNYPIVNQKGIYLGMMNKKHLLYPNKKKVILVDHNEYSQSAKDLDQAEILEIIDYYKIGDISITLPIYFRNMPVGSICIIIYNML
ncbi:DHH family phosphoesterase [Garciella nitratireducens]|uniref:DHH family n=1 Tax=Garciella nitratireducens DSM 15102 TaxID=1121911 RepID=A0A1T4KMW3_9FIRM|nr:DHH family phosphoesterase [Garciella nitratireducens]SJZ43745.1 DHH family [Garciella nitratireducens DSM 15102]